MDKDRKTIEVLQNLLILVTVCITFHFKTTIVQNCYGSDQEVVNDEEAFEQLADQVATDVAVAYRASPFSTLSKDYFSRFSRDPSARPQKNETLIDTNWEIVYSSNAQSLTKLMAEYFADFLNCRMELNVTTKKLAPGALKKGVEKAIILDEYGGGDSDALHSFSIKVEGNRILVQGADYLGLRDAVVKMVEIIGLRQAPILAVGENVYRPRIDLRVGVLPWMGNCRDLVFAGYNAVILSADKNPLTFAKIYGDQLSLYALSKSDTIAELKDLRDPEALQRLVNSAKEARRHGLKIYCFFNTLEKFPKDHPIFKAHPDVLGTLTWRKDGEYSLCTEHPLVIQYLTESVRGVFEAIDGLEGVAIIVGAESFYHCYTFPYGAKPGHTTCKRCEKLGAETVVSSLCHRLLDAAREVNPEAQIFAWPYQAYPWSADENQLEFIKRLKPGMAILTETVNRDTIEKPEGVKKIIQDYSIDPIGPGKRALAQIEACHNQGIQIHIKSEPELAFEIPALPHVPCLDRRVARADALARSGIDGVWLFPYFKPCYGTSSVEVHKFFWWQPIPDKEQLLQRFAARIAGEKAGPYLRGAWKYVSEAIPWSPEVCLPHYVGPYYLGPAHPLCADPEAALPEIFYANFLFHRETSYAEALKRKPAFITSPTGDVPVFGRFYRQMEDILAKAVAEIKTAEEFVSQRHRLTFDAEALPIRWFYHTVRTQANFYESCQLRDQLLALAAKDFRTAEETTLAQDHYNKWHQILLDEKQNAAESIPVIKADSRLDFSLDFTLSFPPAVDMIHEKLNLIDYEINVFLPSIAHRCGIEFVRSNE